MDTFLLFLLRVNIAIAIFYILYRMLFCGDTFFRIKRFVLLAILFFCLFYPLIDITQWLVGSKGVQEYMEPMLLSGDTLPYIQVFFETGKENLFLEVLDYFYMSGAVFLGIKIFFEGYSMFRFCRNGKYDNWHNCRIIYTEGNVSPFSFFKYIFINPDKYNECERGEILVHESVHARQWHSLDILFIELMSVLCWFNPFLWLIRKELRLNLEHLADRGVVAAGYDPKMYQYHLLNISTGHHISTRFVNYFNMSHFKRRIRMINKNRSSGFSFMKYILVVPLAMLLVYSVNAGEAVNSLKDKLSSIVVPADREMSSVEVLEKDKTGLSINAGNPDTYSILYEECDKYPQYPGGTEKLMAFFRKNLTYPVSALRDSVEGMVVIQFIVETDGSLSARKIVRGIRKDLNDEALRILAYMPEWEPGEQDGRKVRVRYILPVLFTKNER